MPNGHGFGGHRTQERVLLDLMGEVMGLLELEDLRRAMPPALMRAVPAKLASLTEISPTRIAALIVPDLDARAFEAFARYGEQNPLYRRWRRTGRGRPRRFSDVCTRAELESTDLYRELYGPLGINHQVAFTLPGAGRNTLALALHRGGRDFTDGEVELLARARPFLIQTYDNALAYAEGRRYSPAGLRKALERAGLTGKQAEAIAHVARGASNADLATRMSISDRTAQKHLEHAFRKLGVGNRSAAASLAWRLAGGADRAGGPRGTGVPGRVTNAASASSS